jgi:hypothetical protein
MKSGKVTQGTAKLAQYKLSQWDAQKKRWQTLGGKSNLEKVKWQK